MSVPVEVVRGKEDGPTLFVCAAIHGDEINGVDIVKRLLHQLLSKMRGTLIAVPIVNVFGFNTRSRYLPDRRDAPTAVSPGDENGSLASQLAHIFTEEVIQRADYGIDLHTSAIHRSNLPQIRTSFNDPKALELAKSVRGFHGHRCQHSRRFLARGGTKLQHPHTLV